MKQASGIQKQLIHNDFWQLDDSGKHIIMFKQQKVFKRNELELLKKDSQELLLPSRHARADVQMQGWRTQTDLQPQKCDIVSVPNMWQWMYQRVRDNFQQGRGPQCWPASMLTFTSHISPSRELANGKAPAANGWTCSEVYCT